MNGWWIAAVGLTVGAGQSDFFVVQIETLWSYALLVTTNEYGRNVLFETITNRLPTSLGVYNMPIIAYGLLTMMRRRQANDWYILIWNVLVWVPLLLTLPDYRYFMLTFLTIAIAAAEGLHMPLLRNKFIFLSLCYCVGSLYLFVDWSRAAWLFL